MLAHKMLQSAGTPSDPNFENVTLLLHGDGTNGGQNNTFIDGSTNNFTITRNGNTTQGSFSPYGDLWSNYFDGTGDSVQTVSSTLWTWATATSWTVEAFVYPVTRASVQPIYGAFAGAPPSATNNGELFIETTGQVTFRYWNGAEQKVTTSGTVPLNTWSHVVMAYDGTNIAIYINGTRSANTARSGTPDSSTNILYFGTTLYGTTANTQIYFTGYISNARVVRNSVVYSGATISVPTAPLTAITNTSLLTCQSNRFIDNSSNNFTITRNGDVSVQRFSPFAPSAAYSTATIGGSGYFDGTGDYLTAANNAAFDFGSSNFTVEAFIYLTGNASQNPDGNRVATICACMFDASPATGWHLTLVGNSTTTGTSIEFASWVGSTAYSFSASVTVTQNTWNHIAVVRNGSNLSIYLNGTSVLSTTISVSVNSGGNAFDVGSMQQGTAPKYYHYFPGYISNLRVVKGTAVYTGNFTPPTAPITAITNTSLLLNFTNASIFDNAMMADLETVGNAQISTSVKKYGTGSLAFDGSGDSIQTQTSYGFVFGTGDFTVEFWLYFSTLGGNVDIVNGSSFSLYLKNGDPYYNVITLYANGADRIFSSAVQNQTWMHVALTRSNSSVRLFINGVQSGNTYTDNTNYSSLTSFTIGSSVFNGYIDDLRITKGVARYTGNFTPPAAPFANK